MRAHKTFIEVLLARSAKNRMYEENHHCHVRRSPRNAHPPMQLSRMSVEFQLIFAGGCKPLEAIYLKEDSSSDD